MNLKEELKKIDKIEGKTLGIEATNNFQCIENLEGKEGRKKVEEKLDELGLLPDYKNYEDFGWYPLKEEIAIILVAKKIFNWKREDLKKYGRCLVKFSFLQKVFIRYFVSLEKLAEGAKEIWERHFNFGKIEVKEVNKKKKIIRVQIKNFDVHPSYCKVLSGYLEKMIDLVLNSDKIEGIETKCIFKGDKIHEFIFRYE